MRTSQPSASSKPPPSAGPWIAASQGLGESTRAAITCGKLRLDGRLVELADVGAADQRFSRAGEDHRRHCGVGVDLRDRVEKSNATEPR